MGKIFLLVKTKTGSSCAKDEETLKRHVALESCASSTQNQNWRAQLNWNRRAQQGWEWRTQQNWNWRDRQDQFWREHQEWLEDEVMEWDMYESFSETQNFSTNYGKIVDASREEEELLDNSWEIIEDPSPSDGKLRHESLETRPGDELRQRSAEDKITEETKKEQLRAVHQVASDTQGARVQHMIDSDGAGCRAVVAKQCCHERLTWWNTRSQSMVYDRGKKDHRKSGDDVAAARWSFRLMKVPLAPATRMWTNMHTMLAFWAFPLLIYSDKEISQPSELQKVKARDADRSTLASSFRQDGVVELAEVPGLALAKQ